MLFLIDFSDHLDEIVLLIYRGTGKGSLLRNVESCEIFASKKFSKIKRVFVKILQLYPFLMRYFFGAKHISMRNLVKISRKMQSVDCIQTKWIDAQMDRWTNRQRDISADTLRLISKMIPNCSA